MTRVRCTCMLALLAAIAVTTLGLAPQAGDPVWEPWREQLEQLDPRHPLAYIELAEELADAAHTGGKERDAALRDLAKHLFALAGAIDPAKFGRSACLAIASMSEDRNERDRLLALADLLPGRDVFRAWAPTMEEEEAVSPTTALALSEALGYYRQGHGNRALALLDKHDLRPVLTRFGDLLPGGPERFLEDCKHYTGGRKPTIFEGGIARMLTLEAALLGGKERSWAGEVMLTGAAPLIEIDPANLDEMLEVDATRPYFVNGSFEASPPRQ